MSTPEVSIERRSFSDVAAQFLRERGLVGGDSDDRRTTSLAASLIDNTIVHLKLTGIAVAAACVLGVGLALAVYRSPPMSRTVLYVAGLLQTIPSIALLALLIPLAGIGQVPAIIALFLYSLLPIVRNTITALLTIDPLLKRVAAGMGLSQFRAAQACPFAAGSPASARGNSHRRRREHRNGDACGVHRRGRARRADRDRTRVELTRR